MSNKFNSVVRNLVLIDEPDGIKFTDWMADNYNRCMEVAKKLVGASQYEDLYVDVWMGFKNREDDKGIRYNEESSKGTDGTPIKIQNIIFGSMKKYAKNEKYYVPTESVAVNPVTGKVKFKEVCASCDSDDLDKLTGVQKAYATMGSYDELEWTEEAIDLAENLRFLIHYDLRGKKFEYNVVSILNMCIDSIVKGESDDLANDQLKEMKIFQGASLEFIEAFSSVLKAAARNVADYVNATRMLAMEM